jgi:hypothetical protein
VQILTQKLCAQFTTQFTCCTKYKSTNSDAEAGTSVQILTQKLCAGRAVDLFVRTFEDELKVVAVSYQVIIEKLLSKDYREATK